MFHKARSLIDSEINVLRTQAKNQHRLAQVHLNQMYVEASRMRFETSNAYSSFETYNSYKKATLFDYDAFGMKIVPQLQENANQNMKNSYVHTERNSLIKAGQSILNQGYQKFDIDHFNKQKNQQNYNYSNHSQNQPLKQIQTNSMMFPVNKREPNINFNLLLDNMQKQNQDPLDRTLEQDQQFKDLMEIEKLNQKTEEDMLVHSFQTEQRCNVEKLLKELELNQEFPELKTRVELERKQLLANVELKDELKNSLYQVAPGKDIVYELIQQSCFHDDIDKIRRDLNEYSYRSKDPSYLFKEQNTIIFHLNNDEKALGHKNDQLDQTTLSRDLNASLISNQNRSTQIIKSDVNLENKDIQQDTSFKLNNQVQRQLNLIESLIDEYQADQKLENTHNKYEPISIPEAKIDINNQPSLQNDIPTIDQQQNIYQDNEQQQYNFIDKTEVDQLKKINQDIIQPTIVKSEELNLKQVTAPQTQKSQENIPQRYSVDKKQIQGNESTVQKSQQLIKSQQSIQQNSQKAASSKKQNNNDNKYDEEEYEDYVDVNEFGIADNYD
eukprot:403339998